MTVNDSYGSIKLMYKLIAHLTMSTLLTIGLGAIVSPGTMADMGHGHSGVSEAATDSHEGGHGHHGMISIPPEQPTPEVMFSVSPDPVSGWNVNVSVENWAFAPERVNQESTTTEGHAHLYVNGEKLMRIYGPWTHIPSLPPGEHTLTVGLNANGHETLMYDGEPIEASVDVVVPAE